MNSVKLKVDEARRGDVGRQIARIPGEVADKLELRTGDVIAITGKRTTYAKVWRSSAIEMLNNDTIKIESIIRRNAGVTLDEFVEVSKTKVTLARSITVTPIQNMNVSGSITQFLSRALQDKVVSLNDIVTISTGLGGMLYFQISQVEPSNQALIIGDKTSVRLIDETKDNRTKKEGLEHKEVQIPKISYEDIGGLTEPIRKIREMVELPLRHPELFERLGIQPPKGVLLYGPPGTGKTLLARAIASETSSHFISIGGPEIMSKFYGESEGKLREIFDTAKNNAPSIIFIDEIDSIAPKREETSGEVERRIVAQLLSLMDGLSSRGNVVVIGATNRPDSIDPALRRGGRFDREIEIGIPDEAARLEILGIHTRGMPLDKTVSIEELANRTHGFVGADVEMLAKEAALSSLRRFLPNIDLSVKTTLDLETLNKLNIKMTDFEQALLEVTPSALREVFVEIPNVTWNDIGGLDDVKTLLQETIEWPMRYVDVYKAMNAKPPVGILLYGPPGTGKTMLAKAVANQSNANFISIKGPELISKWVGESEKGVREIFRKARSAAPCIIFFDEIDSIASIRSSQGSDSGVTQRVVSQLLTEIDGLEEMKGVTILAATNRPDMIDAALMRPGRFDKVILVGNPNKETRMEIFKVHFNHMKVSQNIDLDVLADLTNGASGAEIAALVSNARMHAIREFIKVSVNSKGEIDQLALKNLILTQEHLDLSLKEIKPKESNYEYEPPGLSEMKDHSFV